MTLSAAEIRDLLQLKPHPTCGYLQQSYLSPDHLPESALPARFTGERAMGSALYFMVTPEIRMKLHSIHSDQIYHFYEGDPLEVLLLHPDGRAEVKILGRDWQAGMRPQLLIPGDCFHVSRLQQGRYALLGTTAWPDVQPQDVRVPSIEEVLQRYPEAEEWILRFVSLKTL
jgi:predicted cupin superfamily sugar epimerase